MNEEYPPPPPRPSTFTFVDDQEDKHWHDVRMSNGCQRCRSPKQPICPDCYQCRFCGTGCSVCRIVRPRPRFGPPPFKRFGPQGGT